MCCWSNCGEGSESKVIRWGGWLNEDNKEVEREVGCSSSGFVDWDVRLWMGDNVRVR